MTWYPIQFEYTGNAPTKSKTYNFCIDQLGYDKDNVQAVGPIEVNIDGYSKEGILHAINQDLPMTRTGTEYTEASSPIPDKNRK